jgi:hypothetical protein
MIDEAASMKADLRSELDAAGGSALLSKAPKQTVL